MHEERSGRSAAGGSHARGTSWNADETFLAFRPSLGRIWVVDLAGTSTAERLFMRTLQGAANRRAARLYLVNSDSAEFGEAERFWIEEYERRGWVDVAGRLTMSEAVERFRTEIDGYVAASESEPWSIHAGTVLATVNRGVVAPDDVVAMVSGMGLPELDDMRGRWPDAVTAFRSMVDRYRDTLAYPGIALVRHTENLWDFVMQQQVMPMFSRPKHDSWGGVADIMDSYPGGRILYGYVSDDTVEEEIAVERASSTGKYLVPTAQVSNLSVHVAVLGTAPLRAVEQNLEAETIRIDPTQVNIAIAITDGDNLQVPIQQYPRSAYWNTPERGALPLGWSMGVSLSTLAPGIWEYYRSTRSRFDEIVSIMGIAYVHASTLPEPRNYFRDTFASMSDMGLHTLWSLDSSLTITDEPLWEVLEGAPARDVLAGVLVGYGPSIDKAFRRNTGTPVLITQNGYSEDAGRIRKRIEEIMAMEPSERSPVNFLMATNWTATARDLYAALKPLADRGVRFLTPAQALAAMPEIEGKARSAVEKRASPGACLPSGHIEQFGSPILSSPTLAEINNPIPLPVSLSVRGTPSVLPGGVIEYQALLRIDVVGLARGFLESRVLPVVEGYGLSEEFATDAWMKLSASDIRIRIPLPRGTTAGEVRGVEVHAVRSSAGFDENTLVIDLEGFTADSRVEASAIEVGVFFTVVAGKTVSTPTLSIGPESLVFGFSLTVGIGDEHGPLVGGVRGTMAGTGANVLAETVVPDCES